MSLTADEVARIAALARLELGPAELAQMHTQLNEFFDIVERMRAVDTAGVEPLYTPLSAVEDVPLRLRDDVVSAASDFEANLVKKEDLQDHLRTQLGFLKLNDAERRIAELIIGNLDYDGYLTLDDVEGDPLIRLSAEGDVSITLAERTLRKIQRLDPRGCGARDLQECLLVQVEALKEPEAALLGVMIKRHMKLLESKNLPAIARDLKVTLEEVVQASRLLPKLDPKPGRNYSGDDAQYITPDVYILKMGEDYTVVLNDDGLSKLRISGAYRDALKNGQLQPGQTKEFVQEKLRSAMWLIRSIHQRSLVSTSCGS